MTDYLVAYDERGKPDDHDYKPLWDELKRLNAVRVQDSLWLVAVTNTTKELHDHLFRYMHKNDRLWVSVLDKKPGYTNAMNGTNDWLSNHPPEQR